MAVLQKFLPTVERRPSATRCEFCGVPLIEIRMTALGKPPIETLAYCECRILADESASRFAAEKARILAVKENVGARFGEASFESWNSSGGRGEMLAIVADYARQWPAMAVSGSGLILYGGPGSGKSHLTAALALHLAREGVNTLFWRFGELARRVRSSYADNSSEDESRILNGLERAELLVLDDMGTDKNSEWLEALLFEIIDRRYRQKRPLVVTTNLDPKKLREAIGERTASRLDETCLPIYNNLPDYRRTIAKNR